MAQVVMWMVLVAALSWTFRELNQTPSRSLLIAGRYLLGGLLTGAVSADHLVRFWRFPVERYIGFLFFVIGFGLTRLWGVGSRPENVKNRDQQFVRLERKAIRQFLSTLVVGVVLGGAVIRGRWTDVLYGIVVVAGILLYVLPNILKPDDDGGGHFVRLLMRRDLPKSHEAVAVVPGRSWE